MSEDLPVWDSQADPEMILRRMTDGFIALDTEGRVIFANREGHDILTTAVGDDDVTVEGMRLWDDIEGFDDTVFYERFAEALATQEPVTFEAEYERLDRWFDVRAHPSETGLSVYFRDVTTEKRLQRQREESLDALQQLYTIASDRERDFETKIDDMLVLCRDFLDVPNAFLTRIEQGTQYIDRSASVSPEVQVGETCPLDEAYCKRTIERDDLMTVEVAADEGWADDPAYGRFGFETYVGGRVTVDGDLYGTLCFADTSAHAGGFTDTQLTFVELLTRWVGSQLEQRAAARQLKQERDRLDEFASTVTHDLRNPLNTAMGRVEYLNGQLDNEHLPVVERSLVRMEEIIDDVLTLAREGMAVEETGSVALAVVTEKAWETVETGPASLQVDTDSRVIADEGRLRQCCENLFRNAIEHGPADVTVTVGELPDERGFYVADDGPGIDPDQRDQVFETGYTDSESGTGFGLSIVAEIVSAHDWEIQATAAEDGGARFELSGVAFDDA